MRCPNMYKGIEDEENSAGPKIEEKIAGGYQEHHQHHHLPAAVPEEVLLQVPIREEAER